MSETFLERYIIVGSFSEYTEMLKGVIMVTPSKELKRANSSAGAAMHLTSERTKVSSLAFQNDTVLQLLKGRPPPHFFLHVYHHAVVLLMAWSWLEYAQTLQFGGLCFNTAVHVVMYYYYFRRVLNLPVPWKAFVTRFQIIQFGTSLLCFLATCKLLLVDGAECAGVQAMVANLVFNMTLLYQFVGVLSKGRKAK